MRCVCGRPSTGMLCTATPDRGDDAVSIEHFNRISGVTIGLVIVHHSHRLNLLVTGLSELSFLIEIIFFNPHFVGCTQQR